MLVTTLSGTETYGRIGASCLKGWRENLPKWVSIGTIKVYYQNIYFNGSHMTKVSNAFTVTSGEEAQAQRRSIMVMTSKLRCHVAMIKV